MSPMSRSDARKRNTNPRDQEHDMATDYRKAAQSLLDGELVGHVDLDTMASAAVHALLAIHDLLAEHIPQPDLAVAAEPAADTNGGIDHNPEPADITEEPPIGTQVTDSEGDVWYHFDDGWQICDEDGPSGGSDLWPEVRFYAPLRLTTDADRERVGLPTQATHAPADVDPDEATASDERHRWWIGEAGRKAVRAEKAEAEVERLTEERDKYATQAEKWQARHAALRADVVDYGDSFDAWSDVRADTDAILDRDDERGQA